VPVQVSNVRGSRISVGAVGGYVIEYDTVRLLVGEYVDVPFWSFLTNPSRNCQPTGRCTRADEGDVFCSWILIYGGETLRRFRRTSNVPWPDAAP
jgi:hypothetical protein